MAPELLTATEHSEASDIFAVGLVVHFILVEEHPFIPEARKGLATTKIQNETETNIMNDNLIISDSISAEACHLLESLLQHNKDDRPTAEDSLTHPYFWSETKKVRFLCAVANQPEIEAPRHGVAAMAPCAVVKDLEASLGGDFAKNPWDLEIPWIYAEMTLTGRSRRYSITSAVDLVRFVRNSYAHVSALNRPTPFKKELLENFVYFDKFPTLFIAVYIAAMKHTWCAREEIRYVMEEL